MGVCRNLYRSLFSRRVGVSVMFSKLYLQSQKAKFGNKKTQRDGRSFASKLEAELYDLLRLRELAGEIQFLKCQVQVHLTDARIIYKPDFSYLNLVKNRNEWAEGKGFETPEWRIKRRLWMHYGPGPLLVYKKSGTLFLAEEIIPK